MNPKLRAVQPHLIEHEGAPYVLLRDPLGLAEGTLLIPQPLAPLLAFCDGSRDMPELQHVFEQYTGIRLPSENLKQMITQLDKLLLLENENSARAMESLLKGYRAADCRPPALSGSGYPSDPVELKNMLEHYTDDSPAVNPSNSIRGIISPHIDYQRGGPVYGRVWRQVTETIGEIDLAIIFGTNHLGGSNLFALTRQHYATPFGIVPTAVDVVDSLANALGHHMAFEDELYHGNEHSIELALTWLHHYLKLAGKGKCELVPILCGSFDQFINGSHDPHTNEEISDVVDFLHEVTRNRRTLVVAAADLAHMGPAFGDSIPIDEAARTEITRADRELIDSMVSSDADKFLSIIKEEKDARRICGLAPIYATLRVLGEAKGELYGYEQCPADETNTSMVSICGVTLE
ncbi:MAG: AmmeMemoRadiSam system protein B [Dehalococcoidia bacterium]